MHLFELQIIFKLTQNLGRGTNQTNHYIFIPSQNTTQSLHVSFFITLTAGNLEYVWHVVHQLDIYIRLILSFFVHTSRNECNIHHKEVHNGFKTLNSPVHFGVLLNHFTTRHIVC
jgi:hypothetical protein